MYVRNILRAGDSVYFVPEGALTTLLYNDKGKLCGVSAGIQDEWVAPTDIPGSQSELFDTFIDNRLVPVSIPTSGAATRVFGVIRAKSGISWTGKSTTDLNTAVFSYLATNTDDCEFIASHVTSGAMVFQGVQSVSQWLKIAKFKTLPAFLMPANPSEYSIRTLLSGNVMFPYDINRICAYVIYRLKDIIVQPVVHYQYIVDSVKRFSNQSGHLLAELTVEQSDHSLICDYGYVKWAGIDKGTLILVDQYDNILDYSNNSERYSSIACPICGNMIQLSGSKTTVCSDVHCMSTKYASVCNMLSIFKLPEMSYNDYLDCLTDHKVLNHLDILDLPQYNELDIQCTASDVLSIFFPNKHSVDSLVSKCNNNVESIMYYLKNPDNIQKMLGLNLRDIVYIVNNIVDINEVSAFLHHPRIHLRNSGMRFDGAQIFRNKKIMITGQFIHGTDDDIKAILKSYGAEVTKCYSSLVSCVLVGGMKEEIDGTAIRFAKQDGITVYDELDFFSQFKIDEDLAENL